MAKTDKPAGIAAGRPSTAPPAPSSPPASSAAPAARPVEKVSIDEFCARLSVGDKRVELIGAFNVAEKRARRASDTEAAYRARYQAFINKPV